VSGRNRQVLILSVTVLVLSIADVQVLEVVLYVAYVQRTNKLQAFGGLDSLISQVPRTSVGENDIVSGNRLGDKGAFVSSWVFATKR
jgi:hypothetical protein